MRTCQREAKIIMVEGPGYVTGRMAGITGKAVVLITVDSLVTTVHIGLVVSMTIDAAENVII